MVTLKFINLPIKITHDVLSQDRLLIMLISWVCY